MTLAGFFFNDRDSVRDIDVIRILLG